MRLRPVGRGGAYDKGRPTLYALIFSSGVGVSQRCVRISEYLRDGKREEIAARRFFNVPVKMYRVNYERHTCRGQQWCPRVRIRNSAALIRNDSNNKNVEGATRNRLETLISLKGSNYGESENRRISTRLSASSRQ